ncbi:hypothetical protein GE21DRAFT_1203617 [Neurospora crassa]|nr:hypothetical protein GE21DRAFT_1203617 [Neurospora crassa]
MKETELEGQARRERESWDRFRRKRKEEGIKGDGNERERQKEIFIRGERYVKQEPRDTCSPKEPSRPPSACTVTENTAGDDRGRISRILRQLEDFLDSMQLGSNTATDKQRSKQKVKKAVEGMEMKSQAESVPLWKSFLGLNLGNSSSSPTPPPSSYSRSSRGSNRGQTLPKRKSSKRNTAELIRELNACPSPSRQAYLERSSWRRERPSGVEYALPSALPVPTRRQAAFSRSYPPPPTVVTVSESDDSSHYQQEPENEIPTHRVYRVPSYRVHPTAAPYPPQHVSGPTANMRRPRRRGFSDELPTAPSSHGHRRHP